RPPTPTLFPYTTLFRSDRHNRGQVNGARNGAFVRNIRPFILARCLQSLCLLGWGMPNVMISLKRTRSDQEQPCAVCGAMFIPLRSEEHTSELQSLRHLV